MAAIRNVPPEAVAAQHRSSDPGASVWVSANAGAGKTYVLSQRVVRLLLDGVEPGAILCLTYTNAAAAEMAGRVFGALAALTMLPEATLRAEVTRLAPEAEPEAAARRARTLFARTLETPGGLKVQTVHAFAAALLRRFPLEANVSGAFSILDEATRIELTDRAIAATLGEGAGDPDGPVARAVRAVVPHISDASLGTTIKDVLAERATLTDWLILGRGETRLTATLSEALRIGEPMDRTPVFDLEDCRAFAALLRREKVSQHVARAIEEALAIDDSDERDKAWRKIFLKADGGPKGVVAKSLLDREPGLASRIAAEQARLVALTEEDNARLTVAASVPLVQLGSRVLDRVEAEKRRRGLIDYDDQIAKAMNLVQGTSAAAWVRYKLDEGIDHIMLDEAQDTSPAQWQLVDALTGEFFAGASARIAHRTLFVVGDEKQSIYSFQGAAPKLFAAMRQRYGSLAEGVGAPFSPVDLSHSFRSAPQVLSAVDRVFANPALAASVGALPAAVRHVAVRELSGGVDVWPLLKDDEVETSDDWDRPLDVRPESSGYVKLTKAIADQIEAWASAGPDGGPAVAPGGVLILTRKREPFASLMNRELKRRGIPAAGSDRLDVTKHIAVQDMLALARSVISRDDLSLAAVLKSPLFGFDEDALYAVAHGREGSLMAALAEGDERAKATHATLRRWARLAARARPFDFFASILVGEGRRADFAARMGSEAEDALDSFLDIALDFEGKGIPAMEPFLMRISKMSSEITRTADAKAGKVRVMTVHGAKGLEADVVFLADVGSNTSPPRGAAVVRLPRGNEGDVVAMSLPKEMRPAAVSEQLDAKKAAETEEHHRLLYVGMTRAERHLVVCGAYGVNKPSEGMWHELVSHALADGAERREGPLGDILAWRLPPPRPGAPPTAHTTRPEEPPETPPWLNRPALSFRPPIEPIVPSGGHDVMPVSLPGNDRPLPAALFGTLVHDLVVREGDLDALAAEAIRRHPALDAAAGRAIAAEALGARGLPELAGREIVQEVPVIGDVVLPTGSVRRALGRIDLIAIGGDDVLIVDFKTDRAVPATPAGVPLAYVQQLAIYRALARRMFAQPVRTALVFTAGPAFMAMDAVLPEIRAATASA